MIFKKLTNKVLHLLEIRRIHTNDKVVFLTFDDGPEGEITNFVLDELKKYDAKATFFCKGANVAKNRKQYQRILQEGHAVGNHTYSHINSFHTKNKDYVNDVLYAEKFIHSHLFRPPWGCITLLAFLRLCFRYKIVYWSLMSGDTRGVSLNLEECLKRLKNKTKKGDIILFHSCNAHEQETKQILPLYLKWLNENNYKCNKLV